VVAKIWDRRPRKEHDETVLIRRSLHDVGVIKILRTFHGRNEIGTQKRIVLEKRPHDLRNRLGKEKRFIPLDNRYHVRHQRMHSLLDALGASLMGVGSHDDLSTGLLDNVPDWLVTGGHIDLIHRLA
jgi:hypothetical protein